MPNLDSLYRNVMALLRKRDKYGHRLTEWLEKEELNNVIKQIETYEGKGKGYHLRKRDGKWAVFTEGDMVIRKQDVKSHKSKRQRVPTILQYRDMVRLAGEGI